MSKSCLKSRYEFLLLLSACTLGCGGGSKSRPSTRKDYSFTLPQDTNLYTETAPTRDEAQIQAIVTMQSTLTGEDKLLIEYYDAGACYRWNEIARNLVAQNKVNPPKAARIYALLSVAQYDTLLWVYQVQARHTARFPFETDTRVRLLAKRPLDMVSFPDPHLAVARASSQVLKALFPANTGYLEALQERHSRSRLHAGVCFPTDGTVGAQIGQLVAERTLAWAAQDNSNTPAPPLPTGPFYWYPDNGTSQPPGAAVLPTWGLTKPWLLSDVAQIEPPPPPSEGSAEYAANMAEVRQISDSRTSRQMTIARYWAAGPGSATPPGMWNEIAVALTAKYELDELQTAQLLSLLNRALMDASISCWSVKYRYMVRRPSQVDPQITLPIGLPNFPSYTSGHSTFSGTAATVLSYFFPTESESLHAMAEEASLSRIYGGIHFRHDCEQGIIQGGKLGAIAVAMAQSDGFPHYI
jgi:hypothetical protein